MFYSHSVLNYSTENRLEIHTKCFTLFSIEITKQPSSSVDKSINQSRFYQHVYPGQNHEN